MLNQVISSGKGDICWSEKDDLLVAVGEDLMIKTYSLNTDGKVTTRDFFDLDSEMYAVHAAGDRLIVAGEGNQALEAIQRKLDNLVPLVNYRGAIKEVRFDESGVRACFLGDDKDVIVYDTDLKKNLRYENPEISSMLSCCWSPNGEYLATVSKKGTLSLFRVPANFEKVEFIQSWRICDKEFKDEELHAINPVFKGSNQILVGGKDIIQKVQLHGTTWEYSVEPRLKHLGVIYSLLALPNGKVISVGHDNSLKIWNSDTEVELASYPVGDRIQRLIYIASKDLILAYGVAGSLLTLPKMTQLANKVPAARAALSSPPKATLAAEAARPNPYLAAQTDQQPHKQSKPRNKLVDSDTEDVDTKPSGAQGTSKPAANSSNPNNTTTVPLDDSMRAEFEKLDELVADTDDNPAAGHISHTAEQPADSDKPSKQTANSGLMVAEHTESVRQTDKPQKIGKNTNGVIGPEDHGKMVPEVKASVPKSAVGGEFGEASFVIHDEDESRSVAPEPSYHQLKQSVNKEEELHVRRMVGLRPDLADETFQNDRRKFHKVSKIVEEYLQTAPQKPSRLQGTTDQGKRNYLCYNNYGKVITRLEGNIAVLDIEYSLQELSKKMLTNTLGFNMASITYRGVLLGSTGFDAEADEYMNEEDDPESRFAHLQFISATGGNPWTMKLDQDENITSVVLGQNWAAATTSRNFIRFFYLDSGKNFKTVGSPGGVIGLAAYEQYLAILHNSSMPFSGNQCQTVRVINTSTDQVVYDSQVVLSPKSKVKWFGFSEEGALCIQDTGKVLWSLVNDHLWVPIYDGAKLKGDFFIITVTGPKIMLIRLPEGCSEPSPLVNLTPVLTELKIPLHLEAPEQGKPSKLTQIWANTIRIQQESYRTKVWGNSSASNYDSFDYGTEQDMMAMNRMTIMKPDAIQKLETETDKQRIEFIRQCIMEKNEQDVIQTALGLSSTRTIDICCKLLDGLGQGHLSLKIREEIDRSGRRPATAVQPAPFTPRTSETGVHPNVQVLQRGGEQNKENPGAVSFKGIFDTIDDKDGTAKQPQAHEQRGREELKKKASAGFDFIRDSVDMIRVKK
jgi:WD40 repeat protein